MSQPQAETARDAAALSNEEVDVWWGSYAGRAMMPSFAVCVLLTAASFLAARHLAPDRGLLQLTFTGFASVVWLVQLVRWSHRFFTCNYRLTTRCLYIDQGFKPLVAQRFALQTIRTVEVRYNKLENLLGVGKVWVYFDDYTRSPAVLAGLAQAHRAAEIIRASVKKFGNRTEETS
jgi:hypothetical protein